VFLIVGEYRDLLNRLFRREEGGRVRIGTALSREPLTDLGRLAEWTEFADYIMEGGVSYFLRAREVADGLTRGCSGPACGGPLNLFVSRRRDPDGRVQPALGLVPRL